MLKQLLDSPRGFADYLEAQGPDRLYSHAPLGNPLSAWLDETPDGTSGDTIVTAGFAECETEDDNNAMERVTLPTWADQYLNRLIDGCHEQSFITGETAMSVLARMQADGSFPA